VPFGTPTCARHESLELRLSRNFEGRFAQQNT
jgi:hypothetical protein